MIKKQINTFIKIYLILIRVRTAFKDTIFETYIEILTNLKRRTTAVVFEIKTVTFELNSYSYGRASRLDIIVLRVFLRFQFASSNRFPPVPGSFFTTDLMLKITFRGSRGSGMDLLRDLFGTGSERNAKTRFLKTFRTTGTSDF